MMNELPNEIFNHLIAKLNAENPVFLYKLRIVNKDFKKAIDNIQIENINIYNFENIFNKLSYQGSYLTFEWLFNNNLNITTNNINNLILNDREDIIKLLIQYEYLKYNLYNWKSHDLIGNDIISLSKTNNPLMISAMNNTQNNSKLTIIKILLDDTVENNPYINQFTGLFDICIKYNNIIVIKYLSTYYYDKIKNLIWKINNLILNNNNIEDLLYYLITSKKVIVSEIFIINLIKKKYNDLIIYCFDDNPLLKSNENIIINIVKANNIKLFNHIEKNIPDYNTIIEILLKESNKYDLNMIYYNENPDNYKLFIENITNNYLDKIFINNRLIKLCLLNNLNNEIIKKLIKKNYKITIEDIEIALKNKNIILVEHLSTKFNYI